MVTTTEEKRGDSRVEIAGPTKAPAADVEFGGRRPFEHEEIQVYFERYQVLFNQTEQFIFVSNTRGDFIDANNAALNRFGVRRDQLGMVRLTDHLLPEDVGRAKRHFIKTLRTGKYVDPDEYCLKTKNEEDIWVKATSVRIDRVGVPHSVIGICRDITERKRAQDALTETERQLWLTQRMEAIGKLAGGIAHDFNNLLGAIAGYVDIILYELADNDPLRSDVEEIAQATKRASELTQQLLAFSRKQVLRPKILNLNDIVLGMERMLSRLIGEDIELIIALNADLGRVKADPGQLEQVIMNLVVNARDAMPMGGKLIIETNNIDLGDEYASGHIATAPGDYVLLAVSDTGMGMAEEVQNRVFEPFFTTKGAGKGTGLGLSTVYGIVKQSSGNIWVYSAPGHGTTFKIYLPLAEGELESARSSESSGAFLKGDETVLLVEDEPLLRNLVTRMIRLYGYEVLEARHGGEALIIAEKHEGPIDLLLTDVVMPHMSGRELSERLTAFRPEIKTLYMSGYTDNAITHQGLIEKGFHYIQKPFNTEKIVSKLRAILDKG